ncbi:MAG: hypothetical protein ABFD04_14340 [Syntrophomonas sp.]
MTKEDRKKIPDEELKQAVGGGIPFDIPKTDRFESAGYTNADGSRTRCRYAYANTGDCSFCLWFRTSRCIDGYFA